MLLATGAAAAITGSASAQLFDSGVIGNINSPIGNWATANNLSTVVPAGNYRRYLVVTEWGNSNTVGDQWSSEARVFLGLGAANTGGAGSAPTNPVASQRITTSYAAATSSLGSGSDGNTNTNRFQAWTGTMLGTGTGIGNFAAPTRVFVGAGQLFTNPATEANARWNNVRVIFNYNTFSTVAGAAVTNTVPFAPLAIPSTFTDLGTLGSVGRTSYTWSTTTSAPLAWFRFQLGSSLSSIPGGLLDMDTAAVTGQTQGDTALTLFRVGSSGGLELLGPVSQYVRSASTTAPGIRFADDDSGPGNSSLLTFGDSNPAAIVGSTARAYGISGGDSSVVFNGRNGDLAAGEYFVAATYWQTSVGTASSTTTTGGAFTDITGLGDYRLSNGNSVTTITEFFGVSPTALAGQTFSLAFVPTPGAAALLGLGGLLAARRRRA
jgi:hypothetical protein